MDVKAVGIASSSFIQCPYCKKWIRIGKIEDWIEYDDKIIIREDSVVRCSECGRIIGYLKIELKEGD